MTIASLLLALLTAASTPSSDAASGPVLLDFTATWCGPCQQVKPAIEQLIDKGYPVRKVDVDESPELAERYGVRGVPTFIVIDGTGRVVDRTSGPQPASELARFFNAAASKVLRPADNVARTGRRGEPKIVRIAADDNDEADARPRTGTDDDVERPAREPERPEPQVVNPQPWETVVRIRVLGPHSTGFGSGTIIHSTPQESLILTCAHIFKLEGRRAAPPSQFPRKIQIDLFDGQLRGTRPAQVHYLESVDGEAIDYDFVRDVGLIRIRPGRRLPASRVVPKHWEPKRPMRMLTVGCSEGHDATAWHTIIDNPSMKGFLQGNQAYEAIECQTAPKQGRSGGGLFTTDGYIAGVCNFAEPQGNHGLYATPRSIYILLDRNDLMALYAPASRGSKIMVADGRSPAPIRRAATPIARSQSPDTDEPERDRAAANNGDIVIPPPNLLGIADPVAPRTERTSRKNSVAARLIPWHATGDATDEGRASGRTRVAEPTDLKMNPAADPDRFGPAPEARQTREAPANTEDVPPAAGPPSKSRWRPVKAGPVDQPAGVPGQ